MIITVPGLYGSDSEHWQSKWEAMFGYGRVELGNWHDPYPEAWEQELSNAVDASTRPVVLVGHSLGSILVARYLSRQSQNVAGAFLVAPTDIEEACVPESAKRFLPIPRARLPVPALIVATGCDPYLPLKKCRELASAWSASLCLLESGGHLGCDAELGAWGDGHDLLSNFVCNLSAERASAPPDSFLRLAFK